MGAATYGVMPTAQGHNRCKVGWCSGDIAGIIVYAGAWRFRDMIGLVEEISMQQTLGEMFWEHENSA